MNRSKENYQIVKFENTMPFFFRLHLQNAANRVKNDMIVEHWHKGLELTYVCSGPTDIIVDGVCNHCVKGDLCLINSGSIHSIIKHFTQLDGSYDAFTMIIDYEFLKIVIPEIEESYFELTPESTPQIREKAIEIMEYYLNCDSRYRHVALTGLVYELLFLLSSLCLRDKGLIQKKNQRNVERIRVIMDYVELHYQENTSQADIAQKFGFSREHFTRYFKKCTGITFREYLIRYRLNEAKKRLTATEETELKIALDTGFTDVKQLITAFKKYYKETPGQYRKSHHK